MAMNVYQAPNGSLSWYHDGEQPSSYTLYEPQTEAPEAEEAAEPQEAEEPQTEAPEAVKEAPKPTNKGRKPAANK